ncbi:GlxA family transcriptional regulator [Sphingomonas quercus]|uniref:GlxA family transcriptional regulator n=1 Tax=Sphingomonas quercus TaxID=2842451 RepID=A0ABS6BJQ7_9SPHN|nr:GlxA family transcriptional regulator [Sphingomonas quercus]MBU3078087.1 GlxA family transcriptional regulator [Sphingomonas quercus]
MRSIAIVIHDGVQALDVAGPLDVFAEANGFLERGDGYEISVVGAGKRPMRASNGLSMTPDMDFTDARIVFDTVLVAGGPDLPDRPRDEEMSRWLAEWGTRAARYGSVCTGAFALGQAGLLDDRNVTTHWENAPKLARMFPRARVELDRIHLRDGPLVTSAGVTAGIDLALALVAEDHGADVALSCAKRLVVVAHRQGGQSQFSPYLLPQSPPASPLGRVRAYVQEHVREAFPIDRLAQIAGTSRRNLARLFTSELSVTPHEFVESVRIDLARNLLEGTDKPLKVVAFECGFGSAEQMRVVFQKRLGVSPIGYRGSFRLAPSRPSRVPPATG